MAALASSLRTVPSRPTCPIDAGGRRAMKRKARVLLATAIVVVGVGAPVSSAFAANPPGQLGYEGQPGNQGGGGGGGQPPGLLGYEGQPGNQGG
jgi:hypothetical protein